MCWHMQMVLCCLLNRGDSLLCDEYTYSHLVEAMVTPKGYNAIPVPMDDIGMTPEALDQVSVLQLAHRFLLMYVQTGRLMLVCSYLYTQLQKYCK